MISTIKLRLGFLAVPAALLLFQAPVLAQPKLNKDNIDEVIAAMTLDEKINTVVGTGMSMGEAKFPGTAGHTYAVPRLGIPEAYLADGPMRLHMNPVRSYDSHTYYTTEMPSSATVAATWDVDAARKVGETLGREVSDYGLDVLLAPAMNIMRSPLCGRNHEYYSEDPMLAGMIAAGYVNGLQGQGISANLKHFAVNNQETNRNNNDSRVNQRPLREIYLRGFEIAIRESNPWTIMTSYNKLNGRYTCESKDLTDAILRGDWGYKGVVMSDWNAGHDPVTSMLAGNDMMEPGQQRQKDAIKAAVENGSLPMEILDRNVKRVLEFVVKTSNFKNTEHPGKTDLDAHALIDRQIGAEGIVLLDNNGILPLSGVKSVALYGVTSYNPVPAGMGFGAVNTGRYHVSLVEAFRNEGIVPDKALVTKYTMHIAAEDKRLYPNGRPAFSFQPAERASEFVPSEEELKAAVKANDVAVITLGRVSGEGADRNLAEWNLKNNEGALISAVSEAFHKAGKKVVVVLNVCSPMETASWKSQADALVCAFEPGQEVGNSIVDVLTGKVNPSGKLPMTWEAAYGDSPADDHFPYDYVFKMPSFASGSGVNFQNKKAQEEVKAPEANVDYTEYTDGIYVGYRYFDTFKKAPSYAFGRGLSYTSFEYSLSDAKIEGDVASVNVKVTNVGSRAGRNVVEVYVAAPDGKIEKPAKELKGFAKTRELKPGESQVLSVSWKVMDMASFDEKQSAWNLEKGTYKFIVAESSDAADVKASAEVKVPKARLWKVSNSLAPEYRIKELSKRSK